ncbi:hypothetical protein V8G54_000384 [Vigna mungo]|uniref:Uncharacterized protein n=1 Tax=Vigna mungo TaxID=3915 RepID=A0AAQ3P561_VIGMU
MMAVSTVNILRIVFFFIFVSQGYSQCSLKDLSVSQSATGVKVQGKEEWSVTIINKCPCVQKNVLINCKGFQSVERINPSVFKVSKNGCIVNNGEAVYRDAVKFKYAWDHQFPLNPISSDIFCS